MGFKCSCAIIILLLFIMLFSGKNGVIQGMRNHDTMVASSIDGNTYSVKKIIGGSPVESTAEAANMLARLNNINEVMIGHMEQKYGDSKCGGYVDFLADNYSGDSVSEHDPPGKENTSYVLNKGEEIKLCLRSKKTGDFHDFNTLVFVSLHELAHMFDKNFGHEDSFWRKFKLILTEAVKKGVYVPVDYSKKPADYCGIVISSSPLYEVYPDPPPGECGFGSNGWKISQ